MNKASTIAVTALLLVGCTTMTNSQRDWQALAQRVDDLSPAELQQVREAARTAAREEPSDGHQLQLALITARSNPSGAELRQAEKAVQAISKHSPVAAQRDLLLRELGLLRELQLLSWEYAQNKQQLSAATDQISHLETQLEEAMNGLATLRLQLEALKDIDNDMSSGRADLDELGQ